MAYCTAAEVRALVDTDLSDAEIGDVIDEEDDFMDLEVDTGSLTANVLRGISRTRSVYRVMLKDPDAMTLGELRYDRATSLDKLEALIERMMMSAAGGGAFKYGYADLRWSLT